MKMQRKIRNSLSAPLAVLLAISLLTAMAPSSLMAAGDAASGVYSGDSSLPPANDPLPPGTAADATSSNETPGESATIDKLPVYPSTPPAAINMQLVTTADDTTAPQITGYSPANEAVTGSSITISANYFDPDPSVGIKLSTGMIHVDNRHQQGTIVTESGITNIKSGLTDGRHKLEAFICDNNYNCSVETWYINVDASAPVISNAAPTGILNDTSATITASFSDSAGSGINASSATVAIDGVDSTPSCAISTSGVSCASGVLAEGSHEVQIEVNDLAGNHAIKNWSFTVNLAAIAITGQAPSYDSLQTSPAPEIRAAFHQAGSGVIDTSSITVLLDGLDISAEAGCSAEGISYLPDSPLSQGRHTLIVTLHDDLGHEGWSEWSFTVDSIAPQILSPAPSGTATAQPTISAHIADTGSGIDANSINLTLDGINATNSTELTGDLVTYLPAQSLSPGSHGVQLSVRDLAGNEQTSAWNFNVPQPPTPARPAVTPQATNPLTLVEYWQSYSSLSTSGGSWMISGFMAFPSTYFLPWYDSGQSSGPIKDELVIRNKGAGAAIVNVLLAGEVKWQGKIGEGSSEIVNMPDATGGPLKIICPSGQPLEIAHRLTGANGIASEKLAVADTDMESVLLLPWFETRPADESSSSLVIANAGAEEAAIDVYVGDPEKPESLKGHFNIGPDSAARTTLADTKGGPVRIVCTNNQPLLASVQVSEGGGVTETMATGSSQLLDRYKFENPAKAPGRSKILVGNGNDRDLQIQLRTGDEFLRDPENPDNDFFTVPRQGASEITLMSPVDKSMEIICIDCLYGEGLVVSGS